MSSAENFTQNAKHEGIHATAPSHLGLYCLLRPVCLIISGKYLF